MADRHTTALAILATGNDLDWVVREYARDMTAAARAEKEAQERQMTEQWNAECATLLAWIEERLPGFEQRIGPINISFEPANDVPPFQPRLRVMVHGNGVTLIRDPRGVPGGHMLQFLFLKHELLVAMPADEPNENWSNFVHTITVITGALERAAVPAPGEVWPA